MRACRAGIDVRTEMELRSQEENGEEQGKNDDTFALAEHADPKTELRGEKLQGQEIWALSGEGVTPFLRAERCWNGAPESLLGQKGADGGKFGAIRAGGGDFDELGFVFVGGFGVA